MNLVQSRETTQYRRWRLWKSCCFNVDRKCIKRERKWSFGKLYQPMGCRHGYAINGLPSAFFDSGSDVLGCDWRWNFIKNGDGFFFVVTTRRSSKTMCTITTKQQNCQFLVLKRKIQNVAAGFALFTVVETSRFIGWNVNTLFSSTCWTIHISDSLLYFVVHTQLFLSIFG